MENSDSKFKKELSQLMKKHGFENCFVIMTKINPKNDSVETVISSINPQYDMVVDVAKNATLGALSQIGMMIPVNDN